MAQPATRLGRLKSDDGSGTFGDMETRVALLERSFEKMDIKLDVIANDVSGSKGDVVSLKGDVAHLKAPSKKPKWKLFQLEWLLVSL